MTPIATALVAAALQASVATATSGACLDSAKSVPMNLGPGGRDTDVIRIDQLFWSRPGRDEIIGYLYRVRNGSEWIGARKAANMTSGGGAQFRKLLRAAGISPEAVGYSSSDDLSATQFKMRHGRERAGRLGIRVRPCVAWPIAKPLP